MPTFQIEPLGGMAPVQLGMARSEVYAAAHSLATCAVVDDHQEFFGPLSVFYSEDDRVEYLEVWSMPDTVAMLRGTNVFATSLDEIVASLSRVADYDRKSAELGYSHIFPELELSFWRPVKEER